MLLDDGGRLLHLYQAIGKNRGQLRTLGALCAKPEGMDTLLSFMDQVKATGIAPEDLHQKAEEFSSAFLELVM